jgi:hypothetical protein
MTKEALGGMETAFYPGGRSIQRPGTLEPEQGEAGSAVVDSLARESANLHRRWCELTVAQWGTPVREPTDNIDLAREITISLLALMRLTEVEVHGTDLDLGLAPWSDVFVANALPMRMGWLALRRVGDRNLRVSWRIMSTDGPCWLVAVSGGQVISEHADHSVTADAIIEGTSRDLLAMLLGRATKNSLTLGGKIDIACSFRELFPGP